MEFLWVLYGVLLISAIVLVPRMLRGRGVRAVAAVDPARYGFVPREEIDIRLPGPDEELTQALAVTQRTQDWRAVAALLKGTPVEGELRWQRVQTLAGAAAVELTQSPGTGGAWLRTWRVEDAKDAGGAAVHAAFLVQRARREPAGSPDVRMILEEARTVADEAALLAPGDPVPYIVALAADGDFAAAWEKITSRAPHHMGAHLTALARLPEDAARDFAERAASSAPEGSLLPALPLFEVFAHLPDVILVRSFYESEVVSRAIGGALYATEHASPPTRCCPWCGTCWRRSCCARSASRRRSSSSAPSTATRARPRGPTTPTLPRRTPPTGRRRSRGWSGTPCGGAPVDAAPALP